MGATIVAAIVVVFTNLVGITVDHWPRTERAPQSAENSINPSVCVTEYTVEVDNHVAILCVTEK